MDDNPICDDCKLKMIKVSDDYICLNCEKFLCSR